MGGKGANQAVAAARLGAEVTFIACIGNDAFGTEALEVYVAEGIQTTWIRRVADLPTGTAAILVDDDAENSIIVVAGANAALQSQDVSAASSTIQQSDAVLCSLETPVEAAVEAFRIARAANRLTVLTPSPAEQVTDELLALCDLCIPNKSEVFRITGQEVLNEADAMRATKELCDRGVKRAVLTMGGDGVLLRDELCTTRIPAIPVEAVDTTGAGDAFTAALAVALAEGRTLAEAGQRANLVAAISVTRPGTQRAFPNQKEVSQWLSLLPVA